jgi:hypothetical protein
MRRDKRQTVNQVCELRERGQTIRAIAAQLGLAKSYVHRLAKCCPLSIVAADHESISNFGGGVPPKES